MYRWGSTDDGDAGPDAGLGGRRPGTGQPPMRPWLRRPPGRAAGLVVCVPVVVLGALALGKSLTGAPSYAAGASPGPAGTDESASSGSDSPPAACVGVPVGPGDDLQKASDTHPEGTTFCLTAGVHRLASVVPKRGQRFVGEGAKTVLSGAKVLDPARAVPDGADRWYWSDQTQQDWRRGTLIPPGLAEAPNEGDLFSQELFVTTS